MSQVYLDPITVNSRKVLADWTCLVRGIVPAVMDGDFVLSESNAILQYAADLSGSDKHYPKDLKRRADTNRWLLWEASTCFPSCYIYYISSNTSSSRF
jgi:glutathione S-transferase